MDPIAIGIIGLCIVLVLHVPLWMECDVMTRSELISWQRAEGIAAWKRYEHALAHGLKSAAPSSPTATP